MPAPQFVDFDERHITVGWHDGTADGYSAVWVRHHCCCAECLHPNGQRLIDISEIDPDSTISNVGLDGDVVVVDVGGHRTHLTTTVLRSRHDAATQRCCWTASHAKSLIAGAAAYDGDLGAALVQLDRYGIALFRGVPTRPGQVLDVARRLGFVRATNYGELFDVVAEPDPNNLAYTSLGLPLHTDNPYRDPVPTVQLLHCLESGPSGGVSRFADGFLAAERLRGGDPIAFETLSTTDVAFRFADEDTDLRTRAPVIQLDGSGHVVGVRLNGRSLATIDLPPETTEAFYEALRTFVELVSDVDVIVDIGLGPGDLIAFDNRRVLHGRSAFDVTDRRHLQGCYIDIDAVRSAVLVASRRALDR